MDRKQKGFEKFLIIALGAAQFPCRDHLRILSHHHFTRWYCVERVRSHDRIREVVGEYSFFPIMKRLAFGLHGAGTNLRGYRR
jgi:hypothetical protein